MPQTGTVRMATIKYYENIFPINAINIYAVSNESYVFGTPNTTIKKSLLLKFVIPLKIEIGKYININGDSIDYEPYCIIHVPVKTGQKATFTNVSNNENTRHELWNASTNERLSFSNANYNGTYSVDVPSSETNYYVKLSVFKDSGLPRQLQ